MNLIDLLGSHWNFERFLGGEDFVGFEHRGTKRRVYVFCHFAVILDAEAAPIKFLHFKDRHPGKFYKDIVSYTEGEGEQSV